MKHRDFCVSQHTTQKSSLYKMQKVDINTVCILNVHKQAGIKSAYTYKDKHTTRPNFYWTRLQLLNPASGFVPSLLLHLDKSALICADSSCPPWPCTHSHTTSTRKHTADAHKSLIKWKPWCPFLHSRVNEYQRETDITVLAVCACAVYVCEWQREKENASLTHSYATEYAAL